MSIVEAVAGIHIRAELVVRHKIERIRRIHIEVVDATGLVVQRIGGVEATLAPRQARAGFMRRVIHRAIGVLEHRLTGLANELKFIGQRARIAQVETEFTRKAGEFEIPHHRDINALGDQFIEVFLAVDDLDHPAIRRVTRDDIAEAIIREIGGTIAQVDRGLRLDRADRILNADIVVIHDDIEIVDKARSPHRAKRERVGRFLADIQIAGIRAIDRGIELEGVAGIVRVGEEGLDPGFSQAIGGDGRRAEIAASGRCDPRAIGHQAITWIQQGV